jgi:GAF domain-containing protein
MPSVAHDLRTALAALDEPAPLPQALSQVVESVGALLDVAGSGIMLADEAHELHYAAATDGHGHELERIQARAFQGPCVEALVSDRVVETADVTTDERWRDLHAALRETRVRAVLGVPVRVAGTAVGSLDAYRDRVQDWSAREREALTAYAGVLEGILLTALQSHRHERTVQQLEHALAHRVTIERAVGMLMERERLDAIAAFARLRSAARSSRRRAADVAAELLAGGRLPSP